MKTVALEELVANTLLTFCENAAELGCPQDQEVDMWFRNLSDYEKVKVGEKLLNIEERNNMETIELDLGDFDRTILEHLIKESCEKDISINRVVSNILKWYIDENTKSEK